MEGRNNRRDVAKVENLLGRAGALDLGETDGVTGFFGARADEAVRTFQKRRGLKVDGLITPNSPTLRALAAKAGRGDEDAGLPRSAAPIASPRARPETPFPGPAAPGTPASDPRRETVKRAARRLLEMRKAGIDPRAQLLARRLAAAEAEVAQGPTPPKPPIPPTAPKTPPPRDPTAPKDPTPPTPPVVPGAPFTPEEQRSFDQLREVMPGVTKEQIERRAQEGRVTKEQLLKELREDRIRELQRLLDILR